MHGESSYLCSHTHTLLHISSFINTASAVQELQRCDSAGIMCLVAAAAEEAAMVAQKEEEEVAAKVAQEEEGKAEQDQEDFVGSSYR